MTIDLWILVASVGLTWALIMADAAPGLVSNGVAWGAGNREQAADKEGIAGRIHRTSLNMNENLPLFAILVLVAHVSGQADAMSALGCKVFLGGRLAHAAVYIAGVPYLRTAMWSVATVGTALVVSSLF